MKNISAAILASVFAMLTATSANAQTTVNDNFTGLTPCTPYTSDGVDATFALGGIGATSGVPTGSGSGLTNTNDCGAYPTASQLIISFATPVDVNSISYYDAGYNGYNYLAFYDGAALVFKDNTSGDIGSDTNISNVTSIVYDNGTDAGFGGTNWWQQITDVNYTTTAVPEPGPLALVALGLLAMAASRKTKNQA